MPCSSHVRAKDSDVQGVCITWRVSGGVRRRHLHPRPPSRDLGALFSTRLPHGGERPRGEGNRERRSHPLTCPREIRLVKGQAGSGGR